MGYEVTLKIKELDEKYKPTFREKPDEDDINMYRNFLCTYCMNAYDGNTPINTYDIWKNIKFNFKCYVNYIEENWKWDLQKSLEKNEYTEENEIYYCGWDYSRDGDDNKDLIFQNTLDDLYFIASCIKTPNYFDEHEQWQTKLEKIKDVLDEFQDYYYEALNHEFYDEYKNKEDSTIDESY